MMPKGFNKPVRAGQSLPRQNQPYLPAPPMWRGMTPLQGGPPQQYSYDTSVIKRKPRNLRTGEQVLAQRRAVQQSASYKRPSLSRNTLYCTDPASRLDASHLRMFLPPG